MSLVELTPIVLDKPRHLLFNRRAVRNIELDLTRLWERDYSFFEAVRRLNDMILDLSSTQRVDLSSLSYINIATLLHRGCQHEDESLTLAQVEEALPYADPAALLGYVGPILQAWNAVSPRVEDVPKVNGEVQDSNPLAASTGAPSGPLSVSASA